MSDSPSRPDRSAAYHTYLHALNDPAAPVIRRAIAPDDGESLLDREAASRAFSRMHATVAILAGKDHPHLNNALAIIAELLPGQPDIPLRLTSGLGIAPGGAGTPLATELEAMLAVCAAHSPETYIHTLRVTAAFFELVHHPDAPPELAPLRERPLALLAGKLLHDMGKLGVPLDLLHGGKFRSDTTAPDQPASHTEQFTANLRTVRTHSELSAAFVDDLADRGVLDPADHAVAHAIAQHHHTSFNTLPYRQDQPEYAAAIAAMLADILSAMGQSRSYKPEPAQQHVIDYALQPFHASPGEVAPDVAAPLHRRLYQLAREELSPLWHSDRHSHLRMGMETGRFLTPPEAIATAHHHGGQSRDYPSYRALVESCEAEALALTGQSVFLTT